MTDWWADVPGTQLLAEPRRTLERERLVELAAAELAPAPHRARVRPGVALVAVGALACGTGAGVLVFGKRKADVITEVQCHTTLEVGRGINFAGAATQLREPDRRRPEVLQDAIAACAELWEQGVLELGAPNAGDPEEDPQPVPPLLACVTDDGIAAVFPTDEATCASLGLGDLSR